MSKKVLGRAAVVCCLVLAFGVGMTTAASAVPASDAAEICRQADEAGELEALGLTRGECVNILKGPSSENANNFIAGLCGAEIIQFFTGTTNKGQCIKVLKGGTF